MWFNRASPEDVHRVRFEARRFGWFRARYSRRYGIAPAKWWAMQTVIRYFDGWRAWARYIWLARRKKRGAGKQRWSHAFKGAACARHIVDGQHRGVAPRWLRKAYEKYGIL